MWRIFNSPEKKTFQVYHNTDEKENILDNHVITVLALFCYLLWGSAFPCIKIELVSVKIDSVSLKERLTYEKFN